MHNIFKALLGISFGAVALISCQKETERPSDSNDYFPLMVGKFVLYDVDSIRYNAFNKTTYHTQYQMRYDVVDSFMDNQGRLSYTINVSQRPNTNTPFGPRDVIHVTKTTSGMEWVQSNARILKLAFPVSVNTGGWNGMAFIEPRADNMEEYDMSKYNWHFSYDKIGEVFDPGNNPFYKTVTVNGINEMTNQPDDTVYADRNYYQEIYAAGVGMVYRERIYWTYQPNEYRNGYELRMRAVDQN